MSNIRNYKWFNRFKKLCNIRQAAILSIILARDFLEISEEIKFLNEKKLFHKKVSLDDNETVHEEIKEAFSWPTVPFILVTADDENFRKVGGYTDLIDLFSLDPETTDSLED